MTKEEAKQQIEAFSADLARKSLFFEENLFVEVRIGEAVIGFEYDETEELLSAQALIYRFRKEPKDNILDAVFAEENEANSGGGRVVFNSENLAFYLQKDFQERQSGALFYEEIKNLAQASLLWNSEIVMRAAEKANS